MYEVMSGMSLAGDRVKSSQVSYRNADADVWLERAIHAMRATFHLPRAPLPSMLKNEFEGEAHLDATRRRRRVELIVEPAEK